MIINCRLSSNSKHTVKWESFEMVSYIRYSLKEKVEKEKVFKTFADADGFADGLIKKGMRCVRIIPS